MFEGDHLKSFKEVTDEVIAEANHIQGYGRYLRKHRANSGDSFYESWLSDGLEIVKESQAIRQSLYSVVKEISDRVAKYNSDSANPNLTPDEYVKLEETYKRDFMKLKKKFIGESWRVVELRTPLSIVLLNLDLQPRRKYQRRERVEPVLKEEVYEKYVEKEGLND